MRLFVTLSAVVFRPSILMPPFGLFTTTLWSMTTFEAVSSTWIPQKAFVVHENDVVQATSVPKQLPMIL